MVIVQTVLSHLVVLQSSLEMKINAAIAVLTIILNRATIFFAMRLGHVVYNNCAIYMLLNKQQCRGFYYCTRVKTCRNHVSHPTHILPT